jgi:SAM-dependent methyltransferase
MEKIFISWSGKRSFSIAEKLNKCIRLILKVDTFLSSEGIRAGNEWLEVIKDNINKSGFLIVLITPENINSKWIYYECGGFISKLNKDNIFPILLFNVRLEQLSRPLDTYQNCQIRNSEDVDEILELLKTINSRLKIGIDSSLITHDYNEYFRDKLKKTISEIEFDSIQDSITKVVNSKEDMEEIFKYKFMNNPLFRTVFDDKFQNYISDLSRLKSNRPYIDFPSICYPDILLKLMKLDSAPTIKAVAVVDDVEEFWTTTTGHHIMNHSTPECTRIFVFRDTKHLENYISNLKKWANKYEVRVISEYEANSLLFAKVKDFSIIGNKNIQYQNIVAYYSTAQYYLKIRFSADQQKINDYEEQFKLLYHNSELVKEDIDDDYRFIKKVFHNDEVTVMKRKYFNIEMSKYINISEYDKNEELHPYYTDMHEKMIELIRNYRKNNQIRILELGAGTGIFTKKLSKIENASITCVEVDKVCFQHLETKIKNDNNITAILSDSRSYIDENKNQYDFIVSSFADHHIKPLDKELYFTTIKNNLNSDGYFIVGDEFLRTYNVEDVNDWKCALKEFHNFIINQANNSGHLGVVELESQALISGLKEIGDFKMSNVEYEEVLDKYNLKCQSKIKIGPSNNELKSNNLNDIGGVYVYIMKK